jgi:hypothetical protein
MLKLIESAIVYFLKIINCGFLIIVACIGIIFTVLSIITAYITQALLFIQMYIKLAHDYLLNEIKYRNTLR